MSRQVWIRWRQTLQYNTHYPHCHICHHQGEEDFQYHAHLEHSRIAHVRKVANDPKSTAAAVGVVSGSGVEGGDSGDVEVTIIQQVNPVSNASA